jgi:excisionase family DNA binding protein
LYKLRLREKAIGRVKLETEVKKRPGAFVTEEQVRAILAKEWLTLKEAALLLNISPLTVRRWVLGGKVSSHKMRKKHSFKRDELDAI